MASGVNHSVKRNDTGDRDDSKPKRMRTRDKKSEEASDDDDEDTKQLIIQRNIAELLESRIVNETFIQVKLINKD